MLPTYYKGDKCDVYYFPNRVEVDCPYDENYVRICSPNDAKIIIETLARFLKEHKDEFI